MEKEKQIRPYESYALNVLKNIWNDEFKHLKLSDRPDLLDDTKQLGIEVVCPFVEKEMMLDSYFYNELKGKKLDEIPSKGLEKFRKFSREVIVDEKSKSATLTQKGVKKAEQHFNISIYEEGF